MRFLFNLQTHTLKIPAGEYFRVFSEEAAFFTQFGGIGFRLDDYNHWINFTLTKQKVSCFYKTLATDGSALYYRRAIPRSSSGIIEVKFTERDRIEKVKGVWKTKCS